MPRLAWRLQRFCHGAARPYLNCINLTPERQEPPAKVQKRRFKEGKPPLPAYCTVVVAPAYRHAGDWESGGTHHGQKYDVRGHLWKLPDNP